MNFNIKILKKGDSVITVLPYDGSVAVVVRRSKGNVDVVMIAKNSDDLPEIASTWTISEGENEIELRKGDLKVSTF